MYVSFCAGTALKMTKQIVNCGGSCLIFFTFLLFQSFYLHQQQELNVYRLYCDKRHSPSAHCRLSVAGKKLLQRVRELRFSTVTTVIKD